MPLVRDAQGEDVPALWAAEREVVCRFDGMLVSEPEELVESSDHERLASIDGPRASGPCLAAARSTSTEIARAYAKLTEKDVLRAFDTTDFDGAYLDDLWARRDTEAVSCLTEHFAGLQDFVAHTAKRALGAVVQFT